MSLSKDSTATTRTGSETPPSVARDSPQATTASITSSTTNANLQLKANINDSDHPPDRTLWLGDLEPWMDDHYMVQVCTLFGWDTSAIHIPRPTAAPNATRHPNNAGYCLLIFSNKEKANQVIDQYGPGAYNSAQPILLPNSNRSIKLDWLTSANAKTAIGKDPGPVDSAIEYSIFVGDIAADVTNADLMNVFRNPNLGLRGDFPPRLIAPFLSCCNAKVMVDSVTGISKGYGFVRFTSEADQKRALLEMQGLYCKSRPMRLSTATAKNKAPNADEEHSEPVPVVVRVTSSNGPVSPKAIDPTRIRSITTAVAEAPSNSQQQRSDFHPVMLAKIAQLSNTMGQHYPAYRAGANGGPVLPPPGLSNSQIQQWLQQNPQARTQLEALLGSSGDPTPPSDPLNTTVFVGGLSPLISEETLRTFFAPFGAIHYVKVPPGKSCGFVQYVRKSDAERAIEALSGFSIGGSKVRLSWGRIPAAQGAAQAAAAAATPNTMQPQQHGQPPRAPPSQSSSGDGPLSSEQALTIVEKLVPALMAAAHHNGSAPNPGMPAGMRNINQQLPPRAPMQGYREAYGYPNGAGQSPGPGYMHSNVAAAPYGHPNRLDYGRNDYYYDQPSAGVAGYSPAFSYMPMNMGGMGVPMSPAMGGMGSGGGVGGGVGGGYGGPSASVLEDQLLGTYGGGIHRLQNSSLRQGAGNGYGVGGGYGAAGAGAGGGYMGSVGGGGYGSEYDADLGGFRSQAGGSVQSTGSFGGPSPGGLYGGGFGGGQAMYGGGHANVNDMNDRYGAAAGRGGVGAGHHFGMNGGMNGFGPVGGTGGAGGGLNGFIPAGTGPTGVGGTSPYDYTDDDGGPPFQATDILRQDSSGLSSYLSNSTSPTSANPGNAPGAPGGGTGKAVNPPGKVNGHGHGPPGSRPGVAMGDVDGMHDLASRFGGLGVGVSGGSGVGTVKGPISPGPASGVSGAFASQQHFRGDSGRYN